MSTNKPRKPRLTLKTIRSLDLLSMVGRADADSMATDGDKSQMETGEELYNACDWIDKMTAWYRATHQDDPSFTGN